MAEVRVAQDAKQSARQVLPADYLREEAVRLGARAVGRTRECYRRSSGSFNRRGIGMSFLDSIFGGHRRERDLEDEIQSHLQMATRDRIESGETTEQAESSARREFGNVMLVKE